MPKLDLDSIPQTNRTGYPPPFNEPVQGRWYRRLAPPSGLTALGVSHVVLKPGAWSSQRHWHDGEDEFLVMLTGEAVLVDDTGETSVGPGDCVAFPMGKDKGGHHLVNRSGAECSFVVVGAGDRGSGGYSDIDMMFSDEGYFHKDGTPYPAQRVP